MITEWCWEKEGTEDHHDLKKILNSVEVTQKN
jgi:hypothetical protein